jgi:hypothetical protein
LDWHQSSGFFDRSLYYFVAHERVLLVQETTSLLHSQGQEDAAAEGKQKAGGDAAILLAPVDESSSPAYLNRSKSLRSERSSITDSLQLSTIASAGASL